MHYRTVLAWMIFLFRKRRTSKHNGCGITEHGHGRLVEIFSLVRREDLILALVLFDGFDDILLNLK